jgi:exopolysaccharide biosynthesis polyprenyl glycosylphosphotransferase
VVRLGALALLLADLGAAAAALVLAYVIRFELGIFPPVLNAATVEYVKLYVVVGVVLAILAYSYQLYRIAPLSTNLEEVQVVVKIVTFATAIGFVITSFYSDVNLSRWTLVSFWALAIILITSNHALYRYWRASRYTRGLDRLQTIVIGEPNNHLIRRLTKGTVSGMQIIGWLRAGERRKSDRSDDSAALQRRAGLLVRSAQISEIEDDFQTPCLGTIDDTRAILASGIVEQALIVEHGLTHDQLLETIEACEQYNVYVRLIAPVYDLLVQPLDLAFLDGMPLVRIDEVRHHPVSELVKRTCDIVVAGALLLLFAPVMLIIGALIRWTSPGPALFRQVRAGRNGRAFQMLKFRTMVVDAEHRLTSIIDVNRLAEPVFKIVRDPRVTPVGRWLRRFSLDELPQLMNVLKGDMSLVGPRPEELRLVEHYDVWQRRRLKVKPGITGLQQIEARGALSSLHDRVRLDMYYTRKQSVLLDLVILFRTVGTVLSGRGAT